MKLSEDRTVYPRSLLQIAVACLGALAAVAVLALVVVMLMLHQKTLAVCTLALLVMGGVLYLSPRFYAWRYVFPGMLAALVFIVVPMGYTFAISFTNYSSDHLLTLDRSRAVLLGEFVSQGDGLDFEVVSRGPLVQLRMKTDDGVGYHSDPFEWGAPIRVPLVAGELSTEPPLGIKELLVHKEALARMENIACACRTARSITRSSSRGR